MQEPPNPVIVALIFALVITIVIIVILVVRQLITTRKPYQFTDDITNLNIIFKIKPIHPEPEKTEKQQEVPPSALFTAPLKYPSKSLEKGEETAK